MKNNALQVYNVFLIIGDFLALVAAFIAAFILRVTLSDIPIANTVPAQTYLRIFLLVLPFWILIFALLGLYNSSIYEKRFIELGRLFIGSFIGLLFVIFISFLSAKPLFPAKLVPIYGFGLGFVFLVMFRNMARLIRTELFAFNVGLNNVVIVGNTTMTAELVDSLANSRESGYKVLAVIGSRYALGRHTHVPTYSDFKTALRYIKMPVHTIVQTELYADDVPNRELLEYAQVNHVAYRFVPGNNELFVGNIDVQLFRGSVPVIAVHQTPLIGWGRIVKRIFDFIFSSIAIVLLSPVLLLVALIIRLSDGGPVFLRQIRLTRYNNEFRVYKFRSMKQAYSGMSPEEAFEKMGRPELSREFRDNGNFLKRDPRITGFGRLIRTTSLDELPQLFNVWLGHISLVGPRALVPSDLSEYEKRHTILSVKSGITGLAQVSGRNHISFEERRKLDIYYVQNWTFWLDISILIKTIRVVLLRQNAE